MIVKPLEYFRDYITNISMTDCGQADPWTPEEVGADHFRSAAVFLTAAHPKQTVGSDVYCGTSIDQMYAQKYGQDTPVPSIQLTTENADAFGNCGWMYSCWYMNTISWSSPTTPLPMTLNPRLAFEQLFGSGGSAEDRSTRRRLKRSILDGIAEKVASLRGELDGPDRNRFDSYLDNVREIERRIEAIEKFNAANPDRELPSPSGSKRCRIDGAQLRSQPAAPGLHAGQRRAREAVSLRPEAQVEGARSSLVSRARYTSPIPPFPNGARISKTPTRVPASSGMA